MLLVLLLALSLGVAQASQPVQQEMVESADTVQVGEHQVDYGKHSSFLDQHVDLNDDQGEEEEMEQEQEPAEFQEEEEAEEPAGADGEAVKVLESSSLEQPTHQMDDLGQEQGELEQNGQSENSLRQAVCRTLGTRCATSRGRCRSRCFANERNLGNRCTSRTCRCCRRCRTSLRCLVGRSQGFCVRNVRAYTRRFVNVFPSSRPCPERTCSCVKICVRLFTCRLLGGFCVHRRRSCPSGYVKYRCGCVDRGSCRCCVPQRNVFRASPILGCNRV